MPIVEATKKAPASTNYPARTHGRSYAFCIADGHGFQKNDTLAFRYPFESQQISPKACTGVGQCDQLPHSYRSLALESQTQLDNALSVVEDDARPFPRPWTYLPGHIDGYAEDSL